MSYSEVLAAAKRLPQAEIAKLIDDLTKLHNKYMKQEEVAAQLEELARQSGFSMSALGYVRDRKPLTPATNRKRHYTLAVDNQTYYIDPTGNLAVAPFRKIKQIRENGLALRYDELNKRQQQEAEALVAEINNS